MSTPARMEDLPHDVLAHILLCYPFPPKDKMTISAVSRSLRRAALDTPLLWSSIDIYQSRDLAYLEIFLSRSQDAPLDVSVLPYGYALVVELRVSPEPFDAERVVAALLPHAARLRSLKVYLYNLACWAPLLSADLSFEYLQKLVVHGMPMSQDLLISLSAPQLRVVNLCWVSVRDYSLLAPRVHDLKLVLNFRTDMQLFMDQLVANASQTLDRLELHQGLHDDGALPLIGPWMFPRLQHLGLGFRSARAVEMLRCMPTGQIPLVRLRLTDRINPYESSYRRLLYPALEHLLSGVEELAEFSITGYYELVTMVSSSGQRRVLDLPPAGESDVLQRIWTYLCEHFHARKTVRACELNTARGYAYQTAFAQLAPAAPDFTLRVEGDYIPGPDESSVLEFPTLSKVVLMRNARGLAGHKRAVVWLAGGAIKCSRTAVQLCICAVAQSTKERAITTDLREWILQELQPGSSLSEEAGCAIQWILCSGKC